MSEDWRTVIEPFKIKSVEPLGFTSRADRLGILRAAHYNLFNIPADKVLIDLLTDSGTAAMSAEQWGAVMRGDESYAGARSFFAFQKAVRTVTGYREVIPVHQGRAAERILFGIIGGRGKCIPANTHFDTTRANVEATGAQALDLPAARAWDFDHPAPFKGNMDLRRLEAKLRELGPSRIPLVIMTVTNNQLGGQPASMGNIREVGRLCRRYKVRFFLDAARFAENAYFIKLRERGYSGKTPASVAREMFSHADGCLMSAKKDALVNMGGFLAMNERHLAERTREAEILGEGFPTYGGLAGRDLEAIAQGLVEVLDEQYLRYRIRSVAYLGDGLRRLGVPIVEPPGGHAVYVNAGKFLPRIPPDQFPGQALACALYLESGVRAVEIGSLMFGRRNPQNGAFTPARMELLRLAVPRRVYTQSHIDYLIEAFGRMARRKNEIRGMKVVYASAVLTHFTAKLAPV